MKINEKMKKYWLVYIAFKQLGTKMVKYFITVEAAKCYHSYCCSLVIVINFSKISEAHLVFLQSDIQRVCSDHTWAILGGGGGEGSEENFREGAKKWNYFEK